MSRHERLAHWELMPGQEVELAHDAGRPQLAVFRFRTTVFAVFDVETDEGTLPARRMWFFLIRDGTLSDEVRRHPWSIKGERLILSPRNGAQNKEARDAGV